MTALVGPSGSGKSTCARLAARLWDASSGTVRVGGVDVSTVDPEVLLADYAVVFQDVTLFDDTVMANIRLGRKDATDEEVLAAARAANCDGFVGQLPQGYDTVIGENGSRLSGGERQRISIARALLKDAPIVLMDEATASLDVENETQVQEALTRLLVGKTVLVIAHRMRTVENADRIVVLAGGRVVEEGSPPSSGPRTAASSATCPSSSSSLPAGASNVAAGAANVAAATRRMVHGGRQMVCAVACVRWPTGGACDGLRVVCPAPTCLALTCLTPTYFHTSFPAIQFLGPCGWQGSFCEKLCNHFHNSSPHVRKTDALGMAGEVL